MIFVPALIGAAIYIAIAVAFVRMALARGKMPAVIAGVIFSLIPTGDYLVGEAVLHHLCSSEAGVKISRKITLPNHYFIDGQQANMSKISEESPYAWVINQSNRIYWPTIDSYLSQIVEKNTKIVIAESVNFLRKPGWAERAFYPRSSSCPIKDRGLEQVFERDSSLDKRSGA